MPKSNVSTMTPKPQFLRGPSVRGAQRVAAALLIGCCLFTSLPGAAKPASADALIPRQLLFQSPTYSEVQISPDGRQLAYLHPLGGVLNVWIAPIDDPTAGVPLTRFDNRPPDSFQWSPDGRFILVMLSLIHI